MNLEVDFTAIYYFLWSLCMLFSVAGVIEVLHEFIRELKSTTASLTEARRDMNAIAHALRRVDPAKIDSLPV